MRHFAGVCVPFIAAVWNVGAQAALQSFDAGDVGISYDPSAFILVKYSDGFSGAVEETQVPFESLTLLPIQNGLSLQFNNNMSLSDPTHGITDNMSSETGAYRALFDFTPEAGFAITSYTVTLRGSFSITTPSFARLYLDGFGEIYANHGSGLIDQTFHFDGPIAPMLQGDLEAFSETIIYEQYVGDVYVQTGTNWITDPNCQDEEGCPLIEEPIFEYVPHYELAYDGGDASITLSELKLVANVTAAPVPVPAAWGFMLAGLATLGRVTRRKAPG